MKKIFLIITFSTAVSIYILVGIFNYYIDPFSVFGNNKIGVHFSSEREYKMSGAIGYSHDSILLGSSKVANINPSQIKDVKVFNAAFSAATPEEMYFFINEFVKKNEIVFLGLDFYMFNEFSFPLKNKEEMQFLNKSFYFLLYKYAFSLNLLKLSLRGLRRHLTNQPVSIFPNGQRNTSKDDTLDLESRDENYDRILDKLKEINFNKYKFSYSRLEYLKKIKMLSEERGFRLVVFLNPLHPEVLNLVKSEDLLTFFELFLNESKKIFPNLADFTQGKYSKREYFYKHDPYHYKPEIGARMIQDLVLQKN